MCSLDDQLVYLTENRQWSQILELGKLYPQHEVSRFLWAWPSEKCLRKMNTTFKVLGITKILSIGCGSGLLEWIIQETTGVSVFGLELDDSWWTSAYSPKTFIKLNFTKSISTQCLNDSVGCTNDHNSFVLLFCYFNNRSAFLEYVHAFNGNNIILIGPKEGNGIVTDPLPLNPQFECAEWTLDSVIEIENSVNVIVFYKRTHIKRNL